MFRFDPSRVATLEADGWRAYYQRRWARLLRLIVVLCQEQFHIPFPLSVVAAFHVTRAARAWAPEKHDLRAVELHYARFYRMARRHSGLTFDPRRVAALEVQYNAIHRELVGQADKSAFVEVLTHLHSELFGLPADQTRESAEQRVLANTIVDRVTSRESSNEAADWRSIQAALQRCYTSIQARLPRATAAGPRGREYAFTSLWLVQAPAAAVWEAISHSERWPSWWPYVVAVDEIRPGDAAGLGAVRRYTWSTRLPYRLAFESCVTRVERPYVLEASASGELNGVGRWTLRPDESGVLVRYDWNVRTRVPWMNALAPIARPLFAWNHGAVMRSGAEGLSRLLGVPVQVLSAGWAGPSETTTTGSGFKSTRPIPGHSTSSSTYRSLSSSTCGPCARLGRAGGSGSALVSPQ